MRPARAGKGVGDEFAERPEIRLARRGAPPRQTDGAARLRRRKSQQRHALVARSDIGGDFRHQRHAVSIGDHFDHGRETGCP
jgi:hypothetical protein